MQFRLLYEGRMPSNAGTRQKHMVRRALHPQLRELWQHEPLAHFAPRWLSREPAENDLTVLRRLGAFEFAPLICDQLALLAEIEIVMLRPSTPGALIRQGGDIDNQLKTLFDALRQPHTPDELPRDEVPAEGEIPFFCLLDDDEKIVNLTVAVDRYLNPRDPHQVHISLFVKTRPSRSIYANMPLA